MTRRQGPGRHRRGRVGWHGAAWKPAGRTATPGPPRAPRGARGGHPATEQLGRQLGAGARARGGCPDPAGSPPTVRSAHKEPAAGGQAPAGFYPHSRGLHSQRLVGRRRLRSRRGGASCLPRRPGPSASLSGAANNTFPPQQAPHSNPVLSRRPGDRTPPRLAARSARPSRRSPPSPLPAPRLLPLPSARKPPAPRLGFAT